MQRWWCKECQRKFADNDALPGMKTPVNQVASSLGMYYEGMSLNAIRRQLEQDHQNCPSDSTVYEWIDRFTHQALDEAKNYHPHVGDTWVADETVLKIGGKKYWLIDIIDTDTRFLLDTKLSYNRNRNDIRELMETARDKAGSTPKHVVTDGWKGYLDGIELAFGADAKHVQTDPFNNKGFNTELIERWHGTLKDRTKVMRGLKDKESAEMILDGWLVHYNYFRPHESLNGKTPSQKSGLKFKYANWSDVTNESKPESPKVKINESVQIRDILKPYPIRTPRPKLTRLSRMPRVKNLGMGIVREHGRQHIIIGSPHWIAPHRAKHGVGITRRSDR